MGEESEVGRAGGGWKRGEGRGPRRPVRYCFQRFISMLLHNFKLFQLAKHMSGPFWSALRHVETIYLPL